MILLSNNLFAVSVKIEASVKNPSSMTEKSRIINSMLSEYGGWYPDRKSTLAILILTINNNLG